MEEFWNEARSRELWILLDILIASILTGIIGLERERSNKPAGFRTNMIVGVASALLVSVSQVLLDSYAESEHKEFVEADPIRVVHAIVVGVSFIGAGTILKSAGEERVQYLTSAATILLSAGVGITVALQQYILAVGLTLLVYIINKGIRGFEKYYKKKVEG
jgi:putative Mg2+ transporter-C (MgtC) family protein